LLSDQIAIFKELNYENLSTGEKKQVSWSAVDNALKSCYKEAAIAADKTAREKASKANAAYKAPTIWTQRYGVYQSVIFPFYNFMLLMRPEYQDGKRRVQTFAGDQHAGY
jgi:hypothetical protein